MALYMATPRSGGTISRIIALVMATVVAGAMIVGSAPPSVATTDTTATPLQLATALAADTSVIKGASYMSVPPLGTPNAVMSTPLVGFPTSGPSYALLTTGDASLAEQPNTSPNSGVDLGGGNNRGNTDFDVTVLKVDLAVPASANCLVGIDFRFLSEEYPEYVASTYNDAFIAELDQSTWTTSGSAINAAGNFAFDPEGNPITINAAGVTSMTAADAAGSVYDGATPVLTAATPITPGDHSLYLSIFDQGDHAFDSAVMLDSLRFGAVNNVATDCVPGAKPSVPPPVSGTYVALGDSYSSGEGNAPFQPDSDNPSTFNSCHRSDSAYGPILHQKMNLGSILFKACSGAVTHDFFSANHSNPNEPDQTSWLDEQTKTVTLTVGGNDAGFPNVLDHCVSGYRPDGKYFEGTGCSKSKEGNTDLSNRLNALSGKKRTDRILVGTPIHSVLSVLERIHAQARTADIYIAGYPQLFGNVSKYYDANSGGSGFRCLVGSAQVPVYGTALYYVDFQDAKWLNSQAKRLNDVIRGAVIKAKAQGIPVTYVDPQFSGHALCDSKPSYLYGLLSQGGSMEPGSFHPTIAGQRLGYEAAFRKAMS